MDNINFNSIVQLLQQVYERDTCSRFKQLELKINYLETLTTKLLRDKASNAKKLDEILNEVRDKKRKSSVDMDMDTDTNAKKQKDANAKYYPTLNDVYISIAVYKNKLDPWRKMMCYTEKDDEKSKLQVLCKSPSCSFCVQFIRMDDNSFKLNTVIGKHNCTIEDANTLKCNVCGIYKIGGHTGRHVHIKEKEMMLSTPESVIN